MFLSRQIPQRIPPNLPPVPLWLSPPPGRTLPTHKSWFTEGKPTNRRTLSAVGGGKAGGGGRNRTGVHGFAGRCMTTLPPRQEWCRRAMVRAKRGRPMKRESVSRLSPGSWSGKRVSNSRPQPWQGCALPTELFPRRLEIIALGSVVSNAFGRGMPRRTRPSSWGVNGPAPRAPPRRRRPRNRYCAS